MLKLEIDNSTCRLVGLTSQQLTDLKNLLFYTADPQAMYFSGNHRSNKRYLIDNKGNFPTGLLYIVNQYLAIDNKFVTVDKRIVPTSVQPFTMIKDIVPYPEQEEAAKACVENHRGIIVAPTGSGKSMIIVLIIDKLKQRTLVVVPSLELKRQLTETLASYYGKLVGGLGSYIAVENVDALDPNSTCHYDCVIIDEFHRSGAKTYRKLNKKAWSSVYYKFGLTATPFRNQDHERLLLESVLSKVIYRLDYQTAVKKGYIVPIEAYYIELTKTSIEAYNWAEVYAKLVTGNQIRNGVVATILFSLMLDKKSSLCLVKEINHGENIVYELEKEIGFKIGFVHGDNEDNKKLINSFNKGTRTVVVGTTGVMGEGIDTKPCEYIIIAGLGKSKGQFMQQVGRALRVYPGKESAKVIIFKDKSHKWTLNHFNVQCKILREEYGVVPIKLELEDKK